jgi:alpha-tubulin suppressor-like RCC1 family protein
VQVIENAAPQAVLTWPIGTQAAPSVINVNRPAITWTQNDSALTTFTGYQVQVLDESGNVLLDSGVQAQASTGNSGSWTVSESLPVNQPLQVRTKVSDGMLWSDWSAVGWMKVRGAISGSKVAAGGNHSLWLKNDGTVWATGYNGAGQLGNGGTNTQSTSVQVLGLSDVASVAAGAIHSLALKSDGTVWSWGSNSSGQLGDGTLTQRTTPVQVTGLSGVVAIAAAGQISMALKNDGTVWLWGYASNSIMGNVSGNQTTPIQVNGLNGVTAIGVGQGFALALKSDGTVWSWGKNDSGQLGIGEISTSSYPTPQKVYTLTGITQIAVGGNHALALKADGKVYTWGKNDSLQLGINSYTNRPTPFEVDYGVKSIAAGTLHSVTISDAGTIWTWGPTYGRSAARAPVGNGFLDAVVVAGGEHDLVLKTDGTVWAWGNNAYGQLGDGTKIGRTAPVQVQ